MRKYVITTLFLLFVVFFFPWLFAPPAPQPEDLPSESTEGSDPVENSPNNEVPEHIPAGEKDSSRILRVLIGDKVLEMDLGTYLVGVVRAEMPAVFEMEALKAQAVAARTYTIHKMENGGTDTHPLADTCDDINCCKAYLDASAAAENWGENAAIYEEKICTAVRETDGECILFENKPILAVFHSSSAGATMDAAAVWSEALPYLVSVPSPENSETVPNYYSSGSFTIAALKSILQNALPAADLSGSPTNWFTHIRQTPSGTVTALDIGGVEINGNRLRTILGLRSPCFTISFEEDRVIFSVAGYGHGVGMSQYGANVLASEGMAYQEILAWYYTGTTVGFYPFSQDFSVQTPSSSI